MSIKQEDEVHDFLVKAESISGQACDLGQRLLFLSRGGMSFKRVGSLTPLIVRTVDAALKGSNVSPKFELPEDLPLVAFDESHMEQVFSHLASNSREAICEKGAIRVSGSTFSVSEKGELPLPQGYYVHIMFSDTGSGIPDENLTKIFDPYFTTKEIWSQKGQGLGLALCNAIIRKHFGLILAESSTGEGTTMHLYLPAAVEDEPDSPRRNSLQLSL